MSLWRGGLVPPRFHRRLDRLLVVDQRRLDIQRNELSSQLLRGSGQGDPHVSARCLLSQALQRIRGSRIDKRHCSQIDNQQFVVSIDPVRHRAD